MQQVNIFSLKDKNIFITGGTGTIGSALVSSFRNSNAHVITTFHHNRAHADLLKSRGCDVYEMNLASKDSINKVVAEVKQTYRAIDVLIHNAACVDDATIIKTSEQMWERVINTNLTGPAYLTKKLLPLLFNAKQAKIFFIASQVGMHGAFGQANYGAAKGGLLALTKSLAKELGKKKILVNAINPAFIMSQMTEHIPQSVLTEKQNESVLGINGDPEELATFVLFLASDAVQRVSGQIFSIDSRVL